MGKEARERQTKGAKTMDIQKIINDVVAKLTGNPDLIKSFLSNPVQLLEKTFGIDLPDDQINKVIEGVKGQIDLSKFDVKEAAGLLGKLKGILGK